MDVPQIIAGRFKIEREIGTGGMGTVYLATHLGLERPVAVKIIRREFAGDADVAERFLREARTMAKHGWFQTVLSDLPHFTFLGLKEKDLPKHGLRSVEINGQMFWIPNVPGVHPGLDK